MSYSLPSGSGSEVAQSKLCVSSPQFSGKAFTDYGLQNDRLSVHFFSVAFLAFMSVAGIPAFLEERQVFVRERLNGLYGPGAYVLAQSISTIPFLFLCSLLFTVIRWVVLSPSHVIVVDAVRQLLVDRIESWSGTVLQVPRGLVLGSLRR